MKTPLRAVVGFECNGHGGLPSKEVGITSLILQARRHSLQNKYKRRHTIADCQTEAGRYLAVIFIIKKNNNALILSARDMAKKE